MGDTGAAEVVDLPQARVVMSRAIKVIVRREFVIIGYSL